MERDSRKSLTTRLYLGYGIGALVLYILLMAFVMPWWFASNHPVIVTLGAGSAQTIDLAFSPDESPLRLVPFGEVEGYHWNWATELPPRKSYELALVFPEGTTAEVLLRKVEVIGLVPDKESSYLDVSSLSAENSKGIRLKKSPDGIRIYAEPGGRLPFVVDTPLPAPFQWLQAVFKATVGYVIVAFILMLVLTTCIQFPDRVQAFRKRTPIHEIAVLLICAIFGSLTHLHLVRHAMPDFEAGTSDAYVMQAIGSVTGDPALDQNLRPGYPALMGAIASRFDWNMTEVTLSQALLFCLALSLLGFATARLVRTYLLGPVLVLALLSPPALWASRHIGAESLLSSSCLLSIAAFMFAWKREGILRILGFVVFALCAAAVTSISSAGLILLFLPSALMIGTIWWAIQIRGWQLFRLNIFWSTLGLVAIPVVFVVIAWTYFRPSGDQQFGYPDTGISAPFSSGMFDVRSAGETDLYEKIIQERISNEYLFSGPVISANPAIAGKSRALLPLPAKLVAWGRLSLWGLFLPDSETYAGKSLVTDYTLRHEFRNAATARSVQESIRDIMRKTNLPVHVQENRSNRQVVVYNQTLVDLYRWFYKILLFLGLAGWMIGLSDRKYLASVLMVPYILNLLLHVFTLSISSHAIQSMDALLWLGALAGILSVNSKGLQKRTDETDRRTMAPIRPKRLFTRHNTISGIPTD